MYTFTSICLTTRAYQMRTIASHCRHCISYTKHRHTSIARIKQRHCTWRSSSFSYSHSNFLLRKYIPLAGLLLFVADDNSLHPFQTTCDPFAIENESKKYFDEVYEITNMVGFGAFGIVMQCVHKETGSVYAVKMIQDVDDVTFEESALLSVRENGGHPHILEYLTSYRHNGFHYLITEFIQGDSLISYLSSHGSLREGEAIQLAQQLVSVLEYLHSNHIIHRDVKPENIMVQNFSKMRDTDGNERLLCVPSLKLIDFGSAVVSCLDERSSVKRVPTSGTRTYWSPEALRGGEISPAMDIWSLGCTLYILLCGRHPFDLHGCLKEEEIIERILLSDSIEYPDHLWQCVSDELKTLVSGLLEKDPQKRWKLEQVRNASIFQK
uniref:Protein kinase putative n=1 Tax=Albugo laibachii Nc14 TaxID=890382 RepID=F0WEE6_9STRA|nr:protein kinase putative [Albugo laibachii Nc14]|eukprot:CCA19578.1 protein kinase putative [Albugo laibachii Nc14]